MITLIVLAATILGAESDPGGWQTTFPVEKGRLSATGDNPYFPLKPGLRLEYRHGKTNSVTTVLNETQVIDGVRTRVVEDREMENGKVVEVTRDYYAADPETKDVYYFGEDVDVYKDGKILNHEGSWRSGVNGARFGLIMPGRARIGHKFYNEQAPGLAMDRAELVAVDQKVTTPAGNFKNCIHLRESSALDKKALDDKWFAPGIGLIRDGKSKLIKVTGQ